MTAAMMTHAAHRARLALAREMVARSRNTRNVSVLRRALWKKRRPA